MLMYRTIALTLALVACGDKVTDTATPTPYSWAGGIFQFSSNAVDDACLDGGFVPLFLPEGEGTTSDWAHTIEIPSWEDMENGSTYMIDLQEPFTAMEITVTRGDADGQAVLTGAQQTGVAFDEESYPGCTVDMGIDALIVLDGPDNVHGFATLSIDSADGEFCPEFAYPCDVTLDFTGLTAE
jgi:hypothetical protein